MITLEALVDDLRRVPPEHLEEIHRVVQALMPPPLSNEEVVRRMHLILAGPDESGTAIWEQIDADMREARAGWNNRPNPFLTDEADAA